MNNVCYITSASALYVRVFLGIGAGICFGAVLMTLFRKR